MTPVIGIIPARGGSKRIPRKNIRSFAGKPLIAHSLEILQLSEVFSAIYVSTDDADIAEIALANGATDIIWRSAQLSDDYATTVAVMSDAVDQLGLTLETPVCCAYATAPLMQPAHIRNAYHEFIESKQSQYVFAACHYDFPVQRGFTLTDTGIRMLFEEHQLTRSQDLDEVLHDAGQFYWASSATWKIQAPVFAGGSRAFLVPRKYVQDLDTFEDWENLELLYRMCGQK